MRGMLQVRRHIFPQEENQYFSNWNKYENQFHTKPELKLICFIDLKLKYRIKKLIRLYLKHYSKDKKRDIVSHKWKEVSLYRVH